MNRNYNYKNRQLILKTFKTKNPHLVITQTFDDSDSYIISNNSKKLKLEFDLLFMNVSLVGYGQCPPLFCKNQEELQVAIDAWSNNRY